MKRLLAYISTLAHHQLFVNIIVMENEKAEDFIKSIAA